MKTKVTSKTDFAMMSSKEMAKEFDALVNRINKQFRVLQKSTKKRSSMTPQEIESSFGINLGGHITKEGKIRFQRVSQARLKKLEHEDKRRVFLLKRYNELLNFYGEGFTVSALEQTKDIKRRYEDKFNNGKPMSIQEFGMYRNLVKGGDLNKFLNSSAGYYELLQYLVYNTTYGGSGNDDFSKTGKARRVLDHYYKSGKVDELLASTKLKEAYDKQFNINVHRKAQVYVEVLKSQGKSDSEIAQLKAQFIANEQARDKMYLMTPDEVLAQGMRNYKANPTKYDNLYGGN